jgi:hypothetical protein
MADAFILPSLWEGWSQALSHAACAGLPLAATDVGGARELLKPLGERLIKPPFANMAEVDQTNISRVVRGDDAEFQARLTLELRVLTETRGRRYVSDSVRSMLDLERVRDAHAQLYRWLIQGGSALGARPWAVESLSSGWAESATQGSDINPRSGRPGSTHRPDPAQEHQPNSAALVKV